VTGRALVVQGNALALPLPDASVDLVVTDPPYGLEFMGQEWDGANGFRRALNPADTGRGDVFGRTSARGPEYRAGKVYQAWCEQWAHEALRVLKPGRYLLAFGGTRTWHRLAAGLEDAGFELRDTLIWLYAQGFPKSKACLKPAFEPIILARKPGPVLPLGIDECRVGNGQGGDRDGEASAERRYTLAGATDFAAAPGPRGGDAAGRWPANVVLTHAPGCEETGTRKVRSPTAKSTQRTTSPSWLGTRVKAEDKPIGYAGPDGTETVQAWRCEPGCPVALLDQQSGERGSFLAAGKRYPSERNGAIYGTFAPGVTQGYGDSGGASRFYFTAKADAAERVEVDGVTHPTVKPLDLVRWLVRLVCPPGGTVLDQFAGSGTTGEAVILEGGGRRCVLVERHGPYLPLIRARTHPLVRRRGRISTSAPPAAPTLFEGAL